MSDIKPLSVGMIGDYHLHPDYSFDGHGSLSEFCTRAVALHLSEVCFTPHYEMAPAVREKDGFMHINGQKEPMSDDVLKHYFDDVAAHYADFGPIGLTVRGGLEFGWYDGCEKDWADIQRKFPMHMRLGAVHIINDLCCATNGEAQELFRSLPMEKFADTYFEKLDTMAASGLIDCIAHIDIYRKYGIEVYGDDLLTIHRGRIEKLFETMKQHDVGYELNTSGLRHGFSEYYPTMEIVNFARGAGVRMVSLGSDAHELDQMALDFEMAAATAYELFPYVDE